MRPIENASPAEVTRDFLSSAADLDEAGVERSLDRGFALGPFEHAVETWLFPALTALGEAWANGIVDVAGEHLASHAVHRRLSSAYADAGRGHTGPVVAVGLPHGCRHEFSALAFATALRRQQVNALFLGADVPLRSWAAVVAKPAIAGAVVAVVRPEDRGPAAEVAARLRTIRPEGLLIAVGGPEARHLDGDVTELPPSIALAAEQVAAALGA